MQKSSGFDFWPCVISAWPWCICPPIFAQIALSNSELLTFPECKMAAAAILDFQFMWIWPFRRVGSVVFVFCTKYGSNICYSHWDRCKYASDLHLMTSHELTSGWNFWSRDHICMASVHPSMKFGADIFILSRVINIFSKIKDGGRRHLGIAWVRHGTTHEASFVMRTSFKNVVMIG